MKRWLAAMALGVGWAACVQAGPFEVKFDPPATPDAGFAVTIRVPPGHIIYAESLRVLADGRELKAVPPPAPVRKFDKFSEEEKDVFDRSLALSFPPFAGPAPQRLVVELQGCNDDVCFLPETHEFNIGNGAAAAPPTDGAGAAAGATADWVREAERFEVTAFEAGYLKTEALLAFLDKGVAGAGDGKGVGRGGEVNLVIVFGFLLGGLLLNLMPCVLPMIPVNLAIIGSGARSGSARRGFLLGGTYGLGMALAYGALGVIVVLTGATFGALSSSPWFNGIIALAFAAMALAMFDLIQVDFSRFRSWMGTPGGGAGRGTFGLAFTLGAVAALLAGACVAPVVLSALLLAGRLYGEGKLAGLFLPFLLGIGMALPWPLAGAGLSFLPKPGGWMNKVKYAFGVLIIGLAAYHGREAFNQFRGGANTSSSEFARRLREAHQAGKPVFLDFKASWCKNCHAMDATTFRDPAVKARLAGFTVLDYEAEKPNESPAREILARYQVVGLPAYVILRPRSPAEKP